MILRLILLNLLVNFVDDAKKIWKILSQHFVSFGLHQSNCFKVINLNLITLFHRLLKGYSIFDGFSGQLCKIQKKVSISIKFKTFAKLFK